MLYYICIAKLKKTKNSDIKKQKSVSMNKSMNKCW